MIQRKKAINAIKYRLKNFPIVAILGARQCGKTTLAKQIPFTHYFDLENPRDLARLSQPQLALENLEGVIVIDEIQRKKELFPLLRFLVDHKSNQKYLILGSASKELIQQSSESLAGRIAYYHLGGFSLEEVGNQNINTLWLRGGFPKSYLAKTNEESLLWRENYITTFLERDIPQLGISIPAQDLRRFWIMLSHYHGQVLNFSELGRSFGVSDMTAKKYISILEGTFMIRTLMPWHVNIGKRLVKSPKLYIRDSGLFHSLQSIDSFDTLLSHSKLGASWEGMALETIAGILNISNESLFFWATHAGAELDLFWRQKGKSWGVEFKYVDAPSLTKSMHSVCKDLDLEHLWIIYPGDKIYPLDKKITALPIAKISEISDQNKLFSSKALRS